MAVSKSKKKNTQIVAVCSLLKYSPDRFLNISDHLICASIFLCLRSIGERQKNLRSISQLASRHSRSQT
jgi:hypothetical protein